MPERNLAIRLSVMDGGRVKAELKEIGESGEKSLKKIELAGQPASRSLIALNAAANDLKGSAVGLSSQMGPLGSAMTALGPAGLVAGATLAALTLGLKASLQEAAEAEQSYNRLQAVLKATGDASGLTGGEIASFADEIEASTLATAEQVQDAAAVMATFRSVSGETFTRAIRLAQDLSAVFKQDLSSSALQLGKALEDPTQGLTALRRVGVSFTQSEREMIEALVDAGQQMEAQKVTLDAIEKQVGGAGAAEATGLAGATNRLSDAWRNLLEGIGQTKTVSGGAEIALSALAFVLEKTRHLIETAPLGERLAEASAQLQEAQAVLARLQNYNPRVMTDMAPLIESQKEKIAELRKEVENLTAASKSEAEAMAAEQAKARASAENVARDRRAEALAEQRKKLDEAIAKLVDDPAEKINKINDELAKTKQRLEALREKDGGNSANVDAALGQAEELARRQIEVVQKPINEAAQKAAEANQKVIDDLKRQLLGLGDARQAFIDQAVSRLSEKATETDKSKTRDLASQLFDQKAFAEAQKVMDDLGRQMDKLSDKRKAFIQESLARLPETATQEQIDRTKAFAAALYDQTEAQARLDKLKQEGEQLTQSTRSATEAYADQVDRLRGMLDAGAISQEVFNRALSKADDELLGGRKDALAGALRAFHQYRDEAEDAASAVEKAFSEAMQATEDAIVNMVTTGEFSLKGLNDLANDVVADITRMVVKKSITGPLFDFIGGSMESGGFLSDIFGSLFHEGGVAGEAAPLRQVPSFVFAGAPRYHGGGIAGLLPGEVPAILQRGEVVLPKDSRASMRPITVVMNISTPDANSFRASQAQVSAEAARGIDRARRNL